MAVCKYICSMLELFEPCVTKHLIANVALVHTGVEQQTS